MTRTKIYLLPEVRKLIGGMSKSWIYNQISLGYFPRPIQLGGGRAVGWLSSEIDDWIDYRTQCRDFEGGDNE